MPYQEGRRLPGERASKLGHLDVLNSELVNKLIKSFESNVPPSGSKPILEVLPSPNGPLRIIFGVDGSTSTVVSDAPPPREVAFVKTALLRIDDYALGKIDKRSPHPLALRDLLRDSAIYHATVIPLKNVTIPGMNTYHAVRGIIYESIKSALLEGQPMETLKWLAYEKWSPGQRQQLPLFECPHCEEDLATLPYDAETGYCPNCGGQIYITDMLGFHQAMAPDSAPENVATDYMTIHETLLLFTGIRYFWEKNKKVLTDCLFVRDGPLSIRAQYSKLVAPIRSFFQFAHNQGYDVHVIGQEKSGRFFDHLQLIGKGMPAGTIFIPDDKYIKEEVQRRPNAGAAYGKDTNYGAKIFVKLTDYHAMVLNIPTGQFKQNPKLSDLLGADRIFSTLPRILSHQYEGALLPIQLANGIASLSTYPSARILKIFAETMLAP